MEKIGFVGTGAMGSALLSRLKLANVQVTAFDIAPTAMEAARREGAQTAPSAKAVAQAATIIDVVVRTDQEVLASVMGEDGVLEGASPGSLVLLHSTIRPATTNKVAQAAADKRVYVIDACMTAVPSAVREGGLTFLVGGQKALFERAKPHLLNMAKDALDLMQKTKSAHVLERWEMRYDLSGGDLKFNAGTNLYDKDLPLAAEVGKSLGADIPVTEALAKLGIKLNGGKCAI